MSCTAEKITPLFQSERLQTNQTSDYKGLVITVTGQFNLELHRDFRKAFEAEGRNFERYAVDLRDCTGMDSAGLGMLLILRDHAGLGKDDLVISGAGSSVRQVLSFANFDQLFTIVEAA